MRCLHNNYMIKSNADYTFKYILIGDSGVEKSSLLIHYIEKKFNPTYDVTIGVDYSTKNLIVDKKNVKMIIWDTTGQENFRAVTRSYYRDTCCVILIYNITDRKSFDSINQWLSDLQKLTFNPVLMLVGNKSDLEQKRCVTFDEGSEFAKNHGMFFLETSAKTGANIENVFLNTTSVIMKKINDKLINTNNPTRGIKIMTKNITFPKETPETDFSSCC